MMDFIKFKNAVAKQFNTMAKGGELFVVSINKDEIWDAYLKAFPAGTDPIYRERTEHDCNCCKQFIRTVGHVVAIKDNQLVSIWDGVVGDPTYQIVSDALSALVKSKKIANKFFHYEAKAGSDKSFEATLNGVQSWTHFFVNIPRNFVMQKDSIASKLSYIRADHDVLLRSLNEITPDAVDIVLDLIAQNTLYRGADHKYSVFEFKKLQNVFNKCKSDKVKDTFVWSKVSATNGSVSRIRNSSIGSLLVDLSAGMDIEDAVKSFEAKVAPANYKRPTAVVTKKMIDQARDKINEMGLTSALERRYANLTDISVNNILFANRTTKNALTGDIFDELASSVKENVKKFDKVEEVSIEKFISDIMPRAESIELMVDNSHTNNFVSLIAPVDPTAGNMFKWDNKFSWSYAGDMADSIKERVKKAGGNVSGDFCNRLAWFNYDDLDFHMIEPNGYEIYFGNRTRKSQSGGMLDVDMNAGSGSSREPVENIVYNSVSTMTEGVYELVVHNYCKRESVGVGFEVEVDMLGKVHKFVYDKAVNHGQKITVAKIKYSKKEGFKILQSLPETSASKKVWNISTMTFVPVNVIMHSPNYWDEQGVGNKHYFFMLDGCKNDGSARGFFNEFLKEELNQHRKVFEMVGSKMKTEESNDQLSGLGFSSTQRNSVMVRVKGSFTRVVKVTF